MNLIIVAHTHSQYLAFIRAKFPHQARELRSRAQFIWADPFRPEMLQEFEKGTFVHCLAEPSPRLRELIRARFHEVLFMESPS